MVLRSFKWTATDDGKYQEHWVVDENGKDRRPTDRNADHACFDVKPQDLLLAAHRSKSGARRADFVLPPEPTAAQMTRLIEHLELYGVQA